MNFYKHHLGDYSAATAHLSWDEDCAYRRLLDAYYKREAPIPVDMKEAQRLARATTPSQRRAVETVLREFFIKSDEGWHQKRCDEELAKALSQGETNRRIAEEREVRKRARTEHETTTNRATERATNRPPDTSGEREPSHKPLATSHKPEEPQSALSQEARSGAVPIPLRAASEPPESPPKSPTRRGEIAALLRGLGVVCAYANPPVVEWAEAGLSDELLREAVSVARMRKPVPEQIPLAYLVPIVAETRRSPAHRKTDWRKVFGPDVTDEEIAELEAKEAASAQA